MNNTGEMLTVAEARKRILQGAEPLPSEKVTLADALQRVLARDLQAGLTLPPWDNSAMDGFAVRFADVAAACADAPVSLKLVETIAAGHMPVKTVEAGEAARIMTGAPVPQGADAIVPIEHTDGGTEDDVAILQSPRACGAHIRRMGEDVQAGQVILQAGTELTPARIAMAAAAGCGWLDVHARPRVAILATGDELVEPGQTPKPGQIVSSNSHSMVAMVQQAGGVPLYLGIARDEPEDLLARMQGGLHADVLLTSGGVSVGDFDYVKLVYERLGMRMDFWKVAMKPGKPLAFGHIDGVPVIGLPGNPIATAVGFEQFVRPLLRRMLGHTRLSRPVITARLVGGYRKRDQRLHFHRVLLQQDGNAWLARSAGGQGSAMLYSMARADGLAMIPQETSVLADGEAVQVQVLNTDVLGECHADE